MIQKLWTFIILLINLIPVSFAYLTRTNLLISTADIESFISLGYYRCILMTVNYLTLIVLKRSLATIKLRTSLLILALYQPLNSTITVSIFRYTLVTRTITMNLWCLHHISSAIRYLPVASSFLPHLHWSLPSVLNIVPVDYLPSTIYSLHISDPLIIRAPIGLCYLILRLCQLSVSAHLWYFPLCGCESVLAVGEEEILGGAAV